MILTIIACSTLLGGMVIITAASYGYHWITKNCIPPQTNDISLFDK